MAQNVDFLQGQQPLSGVVLCCTSVPQDVRTHLAAMATEMGAVPKLDLTSDVTHLIVGSIATPKYRYVAKERPDIKVLLPSWLEETRTLWMAGADVDAVELERKHRCPPFYGLQICLTGFDQLQQRTDISTTVVEQGASYHGDLTKAVTHLIAAAPHGQKYTHAKKWEITAVSLKWFADSLERGMALDEAFYDPTLPIEEQGKGAFKRQRTSLGKHGREESASKPDNTDLARKRLRRTASTRLESQSQDLWQDMSAEPLKMDDLNHDSWRDDRSQSSADTSTAISHRAFDAHLKTVDIPSKEASHVVTVDALFCGNHILVLGFDRKRTSRLEQVLLENGATVVHTIAELEDASTQPLSQTRYLLSPHAGSTRPKDFQPLPAGTILATEWWVERCLFHKRVLDPAIDALSRPLGDSKISEFDTLLISTTGFSGVDLRQVAEAVKLMGATYQEKVLPTSSVIVCYSTEIKKEKAFYAKKHQIPVVSAEWLWACLEASRSLPFDAFEVTLPSFNKDDFRADRSAAAPDRNSQQERTGGTAVTRDSKKDNYKRLSSSRKRQITPSLALHASKPSTSNTTSRAKAIFLEDDGEDDSFQTECEAARTMLAAKQAESQPLQEVSPNLSPGKANREVTQRTWLGGDADKHQVRSVSPAKTTPAHDDSSREVLTNVANGQPPAPRSHVELTADLAELLNKTGSSRASSTGPREVPQRRKARQLGRASSGTCARSISASAPAQPHHPLPDGDVGDVDHLNSKQDVQPPPSTQLGYETPESQAHRLQMSKKMGTKLYDDPDERRVPSLGVVKDTSLLADAGVGNRVKGRGRVK